MGMATVDEDEKLQRHIEADAMACKGLRTEGVVR
jgi:hypothetical protein